MNIRRGMFRLWVLFTGAWLLGCAVDDTSPFTRNPEFDPHKLAVANDRLDEAHDRITEIVEAIHEQAAKAPLTHLIDVAIVLSVCSENPIDTADRATLDEVGALGTDGATMLTNTLALALLKLAGIPPEACSVDRVYETLERSKIEHRSEGIAGTA